MKYYIERKLVLPANHDRGTVTEWRKVTVNTTTIPMEFLNRDDGYRHMSRIDTPGQYRLVDENGKDCAGLLVTSWKGAA
ncbi:hypothetical protein CC53_gp144 [Rhizobium phage vB_RleS_L338C]|uniref:hypothetical protein n=1 Tax=Rhizobium phage vB_RleS_L338C TaxID=1414737 RepID=UPI0003D8B357|nr:hypothetical protein CC53_gp144 [Rhizobium phage vB_RleS_L338C]AHC30561.1 hypothetical protein L338C_144 [Rhizobium phage vB_RleS_L338C]QNH72165.1 hypothetical protein P11VFA_006 [Rhizobium phage P11VFA]